MLVYAHRAGRGLASENTLFACEIALQFDIDFIDFDVGLTKDGMLVVTHDLTLNPYITQDAQGKFIKNPIPIFELTYQALSQYNVGQIDPNSSYAKYFPNQKHALNAKIPLLKEAIDYVQSLSNRTVKFQLEIKTDPTQPHMTASSKEFADILYTLLKEKQILDQTEIQAFDFNFLAELQSIDSQIKTSYLTHPFDDTAISPLWYGGHSVAHFDGSFPKMIKSLGGHCWGPFQGDVTHANLIESKNLGLKVVPWGYPEKEGTEFNFSQISKLIAWGVDGIITDRPDILIQII